MFGDTTYHQIIRKVVIAFGTLFNDISIVRRNLNGQTVERLKIPITYAPKQKYNVRTNENPELNKQVSITYPRMSYLISSISYAPARKISSLQRNVVPNDGNTRKSQLAPVPYDLSFELYIFGNNSDDIVQIVEKILPKFTPKYSITIDSIPELELKDDIDIVLNDSVFEDPVVGQFDDNRLITWTLRFKVPINLYGPITDQSIIRKIQTDILVVKSGEITDDSMSKTPRVARIITEPDPIDALPEDDFGFTTSIYEYDDSKKYNPTTGEDEDIEN